MIRFIVILLILLLGFIYNTDFIRGNTDKRRKKYIFVISILLILQSGLRNWAVGSDTYQYYYMFNDVLSQSWSDLWYNFFHNVGKDPFYDIFQKFFQIFTTNYQWYLIFVAFIFMSSFGLFIYRNTTKITHAMIAYIVYMGYYYGFFSITGVRQTIATAILLFSYEFIKKRKLFIFIILVLFASLIHISALVFLPLYFILEIKKPRLILWLSLLGFPLIMIFKNQLAMFFVNTLQMEDRFGVYAEQFERGGSTVLTSFHIVLTFIALFLYNKTKLVNQNIYRMYNMFALALFFLPLQWVNPSAGRISQYFALIMTVWIPYLLDAISGESKKKKEIIYGTAVLSFIIVTFFAIHAESEYKFFWEYLPIPY